MSIQLGTAPAGQASLTSACYRELRPALDGYRLLSATVTVTLLDDPHRARYEYECHLETTGEVPARYWCYYLPADVPEVADVRAWDPRGKLVPNVYRGEKGGSRLEVRLRDPVRQGERYTFGFGYETTIRPVVARDGRKRTVTYADWVIFNIPCVLLQVHVELPGAAEPVLAVPACAEDEGWRVSYRLRALRPLETVSFMVAYRRTPRPRAGAAMHAAGIMAAAGFLGSGLRR
jgi:hypothetical protein